MPRGQQYAVGVVQWFLMRVLDCGASLRGAAATSAAIDAATGGDDLGADRSTGRLWLLRLGLAALLRPKDRADDWAWMIDHSSQIGSCQCLVILGLRLSALPVGRALGHGDVEPIAVVPMTDSTKAAVAARLEEAAVHTGVPRVILNDHGSDLHGGVEIFRAAHPETVEIYDLTHKAACLLKARLEGDERWKSYTSALVQTKSRVQQTELACLVPPSPRAKARFMNVGPLVDWGVRTLARLGEPARLEALGIDAGRLCDKVGWRVGYRVGRGVWWGYQAVIDATLDVVRREGLYAGVEIDLAAAVPERSGAAGGLRADLMAFVRQEGLKARPGERLPGTTKVLESCFGKLKALEEGQSKGGFTGLGLSLGARVSEWTAERIGEALERCRVHDVLQWCRERLGRTVQSQRQQAYGAPAGATKPG